MFTKDDFYSIVDLCTWQNGRTQNSFSHMAFEQKKFFIEYKLLEDALYEDMNKYVIR